jgi:hypothetical protein
MQVNVHNIERTAFKGFPQKDPDAKPFVALHLHDGDAYVSLLLHSVGDFDKLIDAATASRACLIELQQEHHVAVPAAEVGASCLSELQRNLVR